MCFSHILKNIFLQLIIINKVRIIANYTYINYSQISEVPESVVQPDRIGLEPRQLVQHTRTESGVQLHNFVQIRGPRIGYKHPAESSHAHNGTQQARYPGVFSS